MENTYLHLCAECEKQYTCEEIDDIVVNVGFSPPLGEKRYLHFCSRDPCMEDYQREYLMGYGADTPPVFEEV